MPTARNDHPDPPGGRRAPAERGVASPPGRRASAERGVASPPGRRAPAERGVASPPGRRAPAEQVAAWAPERRAEVHRYLLASGARWAPLLAATLALGLIVWLAPPVTSTRVASSGGTVASGATPVATGPSAAGNDGAATAAGGAGQSSSSAQTAAAAPTAAGSSSAATAAAGGGTGATLSGAACRPGVKQFTWSPYAPPCAPAFHGSNGGATSRGVTSNTITLTFAEPSQSTMQLVDTFAGYANINVPEYVADMDTYINYFNTQFELYGRSVVLKPFTAQGNFLLEDGGQDLSGAEADAQTAASIPAFADVTFPLLSAAPYLQDLSQAQVINTGGLGEPTQWFSQYAPYAYSEVPTGSAAASGFGNLMCARLAGMPAVFSPQFSTRTRVFGLITPESPQYQQVAEALMAAASHCGAKFAVWEQYTLGSLQTYQSQAVSIVAKMKSEGVTTVVCGCDPIFPIQLSNAASQQEYTPEWIAIAWEDPITQSYNQSEWSHAISEEGQSPPPQSLEAYKVFEAASGGKPPEEQYFWAAYYTLLMVYSALQLAGPDLTPATFQRGWFSYPTSPLGQAGIWSGGNGAYSLDDVTTQLGWYDPNAVSYQDGKPGAWEDCEGGRYFYLQDPNGWGTPHTQLDCFNG